jgi:hypothetical protein
MNDPYTAPEVCAACGGHLDLHGPGVVVTFKLRNQPELRKAAEKFVTVTFKKTGHSASCLVPEPDSPGAKEGISLVAVCCSDDYAKALKAEEAEECEIQGVGLENN